MLFVTILKLSKTLGKTCEMVTFLRNKIWEGDLNTRFYLFSIKSHSCIRETVELLKRCHLGFYILSEQHMCANIAVRSADSCVLPSHSWVHLLMCCFQESECDTYCSTHTHLISAKAHNCSVLQNISYESEQQLKWWTHDVFHLCLGLSGLYGKSLYHIIFQTLKNRH